MRRFSSHRGLVAFGLLSFCALGAVGIIAAAFAGTPVLSNAPKAPPAAQAESVSVAPHRAIYRMNLSSVRNGGNITDVSGRMLFEWRDVCDGWAIQQHMNLHFSYADNDDQDVISTELTWEAKDGKQYNFNIRRTTDGRETENYRGKAVQNEDSSVSAVYGVPEGKTARFPIGTIFPAAHTKLILQQASMGQADGKQFFSRRVFDGSDEDGSSDISAFILPQRAKEAEPVLSAKIKENPLLTGAEWPVHMAFFNVGSETGEPDYEMDMDFLANGIARHMKIDYGDFSVTGNLEEVEALPAPNCQ